jgi:SAM-dependent methyltransferase
MIPSPDILFRRAYAKRLERMYAKAGSARDLPWYSARIPDMLKNVVGKRTSKGRALDIGCGAGAYSIFLAQNGFKVTGIDYVENALRLARQQAGRMHAKIEFVHADFLTWRSPVKYSLILDAGCLHGIRGKSRNCYRSQLLSMLDYEGDFILLHLEKKHALDWFPYGPLRMGRNAIASWLSPGLKEHVYMQTRPDLCFPVMRNAVVGTYWFKRA